MAKVQVMTKGAWAALIAVLLAAWLGTLFVARNSGFSDGFKEGRKHELEWTCTEARITYQNYRYVPEEGLERALKEACVSGVSKMAWEKQYNEPLHFDR